VEISRLLSLLLFLPPTASRPRTPADDLFYINPSPMAFTAAIAKPAYKVELHPAINRPLGYSVPRRRHSSSLPPLAPHRNKSRTHAQAR